MGEVVMPAGRQVEISCGGSAGGGAFRFLGSPLNPDPNLNLNLIFILPADYERD
jgi:hypothetical protein